MHGGGEKGQVTNHADTHREGIEGDKQHAHLHVQAEGETGGHRDGRYQKLYEEGDQNRRQERRDQPQAGRARLREDHLEIARAQVRRDQKQAKRRAENYQEYLHFIERDADDVEHRQFRGHEQLRQREQYDDPEENQAERQEQAAAPEVNEMCRMLAHNRPSIGASTGFQRFGWDRTGRVWHAGTTGIPFQDFHERLFQSNLLQRAFDQPGAGVPRKLHEIVKALGRDRPPHDFPAALGVEQVFGCAAVRFEGHLIEGLFASEEVLQAVFSDDAASLDDGDARGQHFHFGENVRVHNHGQAAAVELPQDVANGYDHNGVEAPCRLVEKEHAHIMNQALSNPELLLHALRTL